MKKYIYSLYLVLMRRLSVSRDHPDTCLYDMGSKRRQNLAEMKLDKFYVWSEGFNLMWPTLVVYRKGVLQPNWGQQKKSDDVIAHWNVKKSVNYSQLHLIPLRFGG